MRNEQKWLTDKISGVYLEKDNIIEIVLFQCIIDYVEVELDGKIKLQKIEENDATPKLTEKWNQFYTELKEHYNIIKNTIPKMEKNSADLFDKISLGDDNITFIPSFEGDNINLFFSQIWKIDDEIEKIKDEVLTWIVKNRGFLWS